MVFIPEPAAARADPTGDRCAVCRDRLHAAQTAGLARCRQSRILLAAVCVCGRHLRARILRPCVQPVSVSGGGPHHDLASG